MVYQAVLRLTRRWVLGIVAVLCLLGTARAQEDPNAQYLAIVTDQLSGQPREIALPVEVGALRLQFVLTYSGEVKMTPLNSLGNPVALSDPNIAVTEGPGRRSILLWDPRPGLWKIRLEGNGQYTFMAVVQGELYVCCAQMFSRDGIFTLDRVQPVQGSRRQVQIFASGYNIDTIGVSMIDERGSTIAPVKFRQTDLSNLSGFVMLLEVPARPFRLLVAGRDLNGKDYQRVLFPLLRPQAGDPAAETSPQFAPNNQTLDELSRTAHVGERKVIRSRVVKWADQQWLTEKGNPLGIRLRYTMNFPVTGAYTPLPQIYPERVGYGYTGALSMRIHQVVANPMPAGVTNQPNWIYGGKAIYSAGIDYEFTVDLIPNYAVYNDAAKNFCLQIKPYTQTGLRERFEREVGSEQKLRFRFSVSGSDLEGRNPALTENAYIPRHWQLGYQKEGAVECR